MLQPCVVFWWKKKCNYEILANAEIYLQITNSRAEIILFHELERQF